MSRPDPWAHIEYPMCSVCVCARIHTHTHTYILTSIKNKEDTRQQPYLSKNHPPRQATSALQRLEETLYPRPPTRMNKLCTHERICTPCSDCVANMFADVLSTCATYTPACTGAQDTCLVHTTLTATKCTYTRASTPGPVRWCSNFYTMETIVT